MSPCNQRSCVRNVTLAALTTLATLCHGATAWALRCTGTSTGDETVRRVLVLLPRRPDCVAVVDPDGEAPAVAERMRQFDAFTYPGNPTIYVRRHSPVYDQAALGARFYQCMLAAIIWHEMAHLSGANEREAQRQEEALWLQFIRDDRIGFGEGHAYLDQLRRRRCAASVTAVG